MQSVIFGGINADSSVAAAELTPGNGGGSDAGFYVHITIIHGDAAAVGGTENHGVGTALAAAEPE